MVRRSLLCLTVFAVITLMGNTLAAQTPAPAAPAASSNLTPASGDFAGAESCATCHADIVKNFPGNPHSKLALEHDGKGVTCEGCHGPGKAHIESGGDAANIFRFTKATPKEVDEKCLSC